MSVTLAFAILGLCTSCESRPEPENLWLNTGSFEVVDTISEEVGEAQLSRPDTVLVIGKDSPFYPITDLAASPSGVLALANPNYCQIILLDTRTAEAIDRIGRCEEGEASIRQLSGLAWLDDVHLAAFDRAALSLVIFARDGRVIDRRPVVDPPHGFVALAVPGPRGSTVIAFEGVVPDTGPLRELPQLVQVYLGRDTTPIWAGLRPGGVFQTGSTKAPFGVVLCIQQSRHQDAHPSFIALNPWKYEVFVGHIANSDRLALLRAEIDMAQVKRHDRYGWTPASGRSSVACGEKVAVAMRTVAAIGRVRGLRVDGILDVVSLYESRLRARYRIDAGDVIGRAVSLGIDNRSILYGLVRDTAGQTIVRQKLTWARDIPDANGSM